MTPAAILGAFSSTSALVLNQVLHDTVSLACPVSGSLLIDSAASETTIRFSNCVIAQTSSAGDSVDAGSFLINSATDASFVRISSTQVLYQNMVVQIIPSGSLTASSTCTMAGTNTSSTASGITTTNYNMQGDCTSGLHYTHLGSLQGAINSLNNHFVINGNASYTIDNDTAGSGAFVYCNYDNFDVTTSACAEYAAACNIPAAACSF